MRLGSIVLATVNAESNVVPREAHERRAQSGVDSLAEPIGTEAVNGDQKDVLDPVHFRDGLVEST